MLVSAIQQHKSAVCKCALPLEPASLAPHSHHAGPPQNTELSSPLAVCFTHGSVRLSVLLSQFTLPSPFSHCVPKFVLYICASIPTLQIGS